MNELIRFFLVVMLVGVLVPAAAERESVRLGSVGSDERLLANQARFEAFMEVAHSQRRAGSSTTILGGAPVTVGPDPECDYDNLQIAINDAMIGIHDGDILVHIDYTRQEEYDFNTLASWQSNFRIIGGADSCVPELAAVVGRTVLNAAGSGRLFDIRRMATEADPPLRTVEISNFELVEGGGVSSGGGVNVIGRGGRLAVELKNVEVRDSNASISGGGVYLQALGDSIVDFPGQSIPPLLFLDDDSFILSNSAPSGGGLACTSTQTNNPEMIHLRTGAGPIAGNEATNGGGVHINRCFSVFRNGGPFALFFPSGGVFSTMPQLTAAVFSSRATRSSASQAVVMRNSVVTRTRRR